MPIQFQEQSYIEPNPKSVLIQVKPKVGKMKEIYVAKPLPTENNLVTEEGLYNSFNFYGTADNRQRKSTRFNNEET